MLTMTPEHAAALTALAAGKTVQIKPTDHGHGTVWIDVDANTIGLLWCEHYVFRVKTDMLEELAKLSHSTVNISPWDEAPQMAKDCHRSIIRALAERCPQLLEIEL